MVYTYYLHGVGELENCQKRYYGSCFFGITTKKLWEKGYPIWETGYSIQETGNHIQETTGYPNRENQVPHFGNQVPTL